MSGRVAVEERGDFLRRQLQLSTSSSRHMCGGKATYGDIARIVLPTTTTIVKWIYGKAQSDRRFFLAINGPSYPPPPPPLFAAMKKQEGRGGELKVGPDLEQEKKEGETSTLLRIWIHFLLYVCYGFFYGKMSVC